MEMQEKHVDRRANDKGKMELVGQKNSHLYRRVKKNTLEDNM